MGISLSVFISFKCLLPSGKRNTRAKGLCTGSKLGMRARQTLEFIDTLFERTSLEAMTTRYEQVKSKGTL